jgi:hypothetical protein
MGMVNDTGASLTGKCVLRATPKMHAPKGEPTTAAAFRVAAQAIVLT